MLVRIAGRNDNELFEQILDYHNCTEEDLEHFAPPSQDAARMMKKIEKDPNRSLMCLDWDKIGDQLEIWGVSHYADFRYIDIAIVPCNYLHTVAGWTGDKIPPECLHNKELTDYYLKNLRFYLYMTESRFQVNGFD